MLIMLKPFFYLHYVLFELLYHFERKIYLYFNLHLHNVFIVCLDPPGEPYIEGYTPGEKLKRGQTIQLVCKSRGGNPPAQLIWYKNGVQVRMAYRTQGRVSENTYTFTADVSDNKARFRCEASNVMSTEPLKTEVELSVLCKLFSKHLLRF